jgi:two-component system chemotaxis response regulator CheB
MKPIRVMIVEDSAVVRELLRRIISADGRFEIAASVASAEEALEKLDRACPDVISLDIRLPGMQGVEATRRIMSRRPTPIVVVSASSEKNELDPSMEALKAGALALVEKPAAATHRDYETLAGRLRTQLAIMSRVKVVRQHILPGPAVPAGAPHPPASAPSYRLLGVVASTGGPNALVELLGGLGPDFPLPVAVVQHMTPGFLEGFGEWLARASGLPVELVEAPVNAAPGVVYLAGTGRHLLADGYSVWPEQSPPVAGHCPSGNVLFSSMARGLRDRSIGVLLTGMGEDGAGGLLDLKRAGSYTIAEDESTAVVYGMPHAAARLHAQLESLPLPSIAPRILELIEIRRESA